MVEKHSIGEADRSSSIFRIGLVVSLLLLQYAASMALPRSLTLAAYTDAIQLALAVLATAVFVRNSLRSGGPIRLFWVLFAISWAIFSLDQMIWGYFDVVLQREFPNPYIGDMLLFLACTPVLAALLLQTDPQWLERRKRSGYVDFALMVLWWLYLYLYLVAPWQMVELNEARYGASYNRLDLLGDAAIVALAAYLFKHRRGASRKFYGLLIVTQLFFAASGYMINSAIDRHVYYSGSWYDMWFTTALGLFTLVGLQGRRLGEEKEVPQLPSVSPLAKWGLLPLLSLPVITAVTLFTQKTSFRVLQFREAVVQGTILIMGALIFLRQRGLMYELAESARVLQHASVTDSLTGCRNRRFLDAALPADASQALRSYQCGPSEQAYDLVFYLIDLDNFKDINDRYGHTMGDHVLMEVAQRIKSVIRKSDVLVRWGGDEFLILSRHSSRRDAPAMCRRILHVLGAPMASGLTEAPTISQTCSIGWAAYPWRPERPEEVEAESVLGLADRALYRAKTSGKNLFVGISASGSKSAVFERDRVTDPHKSHDPALVQLVVSLAEVMV